MAGSVSFAMVWLHVLYDKFVYTFSNPDIRKSVAPHLFGTAR